MTLALTCFGSRRNHHQGAVLCLAKTTIMVFTVLIGIDAVNVMAEYQPVVQARLHIRLIFRHNIDYIHTDEHSKNYNCSFS